jgi:hypothetical protein
MVAGSWLPVRIQVSGVRCQRYYWTTPEYEDEYEDE